ncbi:hypothetical protein GGR57DRAFT_482396 [Xylariaceae sp. FL1272]|nr:hypothetical protein GGR57DRAFT_482396 [Xylariaceae sp. FL1272]
MPGLNSMPSANGSGHTAIRRVSSTHNPQHQQANTPPPRSESPSLNILPSNQQAFHDVSGNALPSPLLPTTVAMAPPPAPGQDNTGVGAGPGPLRHPRPLTAAELHSELEQEQELLVNRLTRDLSMLRMAQNSSVVSNASSTSASNSVVDQLHPSSFTDTHILSGPGYPVPTTRRHHRTSSSASSRSFSHIASQGSSAPISIPQSGHSGNAASVLEAARNPRGPTSMSRQNSTTSHRSTSRTRSPHPYHGTGSGYLPSPHLPTHALPHEYAPGYFHRGRTSSNTSVAATPGSELSPGLMPATLRYEETAHYRQELEVAKRENETLKKRVKELEKMLRDQRSDVASDTTSIGRGRSTSNSTATSFSVTGTTGVGGNMGGGTGIAGGRRDERRGIERAPSAMSVAGSVGVGVPLDEVKVGESASSAGVR